MEDHSTEKKTPFRVLRTIGWILAGLFALYLVAGFWLIPRLVRPRIEEELSTRLGREVRIQEIRMNPLALTVTATGLTVQGKDGQPFAGFEELFVDAGISSLVKWAAAVDEIRLKGPFAVLELLPDQRTNVDDILERLGQPDPEPEPEAGLPRAVITRMAVEEGRFTFVNAVGSEPVEEIFHPVAFTLENLTTLQEQDGNYRFTGIGPMGGSYELEGNVSVNPVRIRGTFATSGTVLPDAWRHVQKLTSFQLVKGSVDTSGTYEISIVDGEFNAAVDEGQFSLTGLEATEKGKDKVLFSLPSLSVEGLRADLKRREVVVGAVRSAGAQIDAWLSPEGVFMPAALLQSDLEALAKPEEAEAASDAQTEDAPWLATVESIKINDWAVTVEDRTLPKPARLTLDGIQAAIQDLSTQEGAKTPFQVDLRVDGTGTLSADGTATLTPLTADVNLTTEGITVASFQPYVDTALKAEVAKGSIGSGGRLRYLGDTGQPQIAFEGAFHLKDLEIRDRVRSEDLLQLQQLEAEGIALDLAPNRLYAKEVRIGQPRARVTIDTGGQINLVAVVSTEPEEGGSEEKNLLQRLAAFLVLQVQGPMPISVDRVRLEGFSGDFVDESISPAYTTRLDITDATVTGLSSDPASRADFTIEGALDPSGVLRSTGQMNPLDARQYTQVDFSLKDFALPPVSPYSGKFVGRKIAQGKLHLDLRYKVDDNAIDGRNTIVVDQLALGETVNSPDAVNLPLDLGVALLKDAEGRITLNVPVQGNVSDPQFDMGQVILNALTGAVTSAGEDPFSTIADVGGFTGEELSVVGFDFGSAEPTETSQKKLSALAEYLNAKSALVLKIEGAADRKMDGAGLVRATPEATPEAAPEPESQEEQSRWKFWRRWTEPEKKEPEKKEEPEAGTEPPEEAPVADDRALERLARTRAERVKTYLMENGNVPEERLEIQPARIHDDPSGKEGRVELSLSTR